PEGAELLRQLVDKAPEHITILAGAGVNSANAAELVRTTGVTEVHASAKARIPSSMTFRRVDVAMSAPGADEYSRYATSAAEVKAIVNSLTNL
ncbi:MAG: copper homeostasis protein CutC, partial [Paramuribaculum sp.]|nr:copper homeostasis protein CutC [Paramuribaculum sp.]